MNQVPEVGAPRLVTMGGRSGPSLIVEGFRGAGWDVTALVITTDSGSSTGVIRERFGLPAPGDIRSVLVAAADPRPELRLLADLFEFRFHLEEESDLREMALGNLILTAYAKVLEDFEGAVEAAARALSCWARVKPLPSSPVALCARLSDGSEVRGELNVRTVGKPPIELLFLEPEAVQVGSDALQAIRDADLIVLGPGGLYCSVLPALLPGAVPEAIRQRRGKTAYICNTTTQPGQTDGFNVTAHVQEVLRYLGAGQLDYVLLNTQMPSEEMIGTYQADGVHFMPVTPEEVRRVKALGPIPILGDFVEDNWQGKRKLHKLDTIRHSPKKVAASLQTLVLDGRDP